MKRRLGHITILVDDQQEALDYYVEKLGFIVTMDQQMGPEMRWVSIAFDEHATQITLVKADTESKRTRVGTQSGEHVFIVIETEDVQKDFEQMLEKGVEFLGEPKKMPWGKEVVFKDLYGNRFDLLELAS